MIKVNFFGNFRTLIGKSQMMIEAQTIKKLIVAIEESTAIEAKKLKHSLIFINGNPVRKNIKLKSGDEVAFFSPVSGG